jgi:hypothetical protein
MEQKRKRVIVFIVYKAGWWGCFDSIYRKLAEDGENECYVIPVPYYERQANDKAIDFSKRHYEADMLPKDVPVTDYQLFPLEKYTIDIMFIHNPYDDQNPLDSVDPKYYSDKLKPHASLLIYVPHLLYTDEVPEYMRRLLVYAHVDRILLAEESAKKAFAGVEKVKLKVEDSFWTDYIDRLNKNKPGIPKEWVPMLYGRTDFGGRRVVLYHVSYTDLLYGNEKTIQKIEYVLNYMKERKDGLFIWRTEPAIEGRLNELSPNVVKDYLRLKKKFMEERIGIYDTTENEYTVSVLADVYMGEKHPLMNLFGIQGKPIVLLDKECRYLPSDDELCSVSFLDCAVEGNDIWFVADRYNVLCRMDRTTGITEVIAEVPDEGKDKYTAYSGIIKEGNYIYLNPHQGDAFIVYDIVVKEIKKIYLPQFFEANFDYMVSYKDYIYLKPKRYPAIVGYNKVTGEFIFYTDWVEELGNYVTKEDEGEPYFLWGVVVVQEKMMLASSKANVVMEFNMETGEHKFYEVGPRGSKYFGMEYDGENYWTIPYKGNSIICWNFIKKRWFVYKGLIEPNFVGIPYRNILKYKDSLLLFPYQVNNSLQINLPNKKVVKNKLNVPFQEGTYRSEFYEKASNTVYYFAKYIEEKVVLALAMYDCSIVVINLAQGNINKFPSRLSLKYVLEYYRKKIDKERNSTNKQFTISENYTLRVALDYCLKRNNTEEEI